MPLANALRQLARDLGSQRLRTFLTTFGIVWGTVAVSLLLAFSEGFHRRLLENSAGLGQGIVIAWPSQTTIPFQGLGKGRRIRLTEEDIDLLRSRSRELGAISSEYSESLRLQVGPRTLAADVSGVRPEYGRIRSLIPAAGGRFLNALDEARQRRVAFLGDELAAQLFGAADPVNQSIRLNGSPFTVVGALRHKVQESSYGGRDKDKVFVPASTMIALTGDRYMNNFIFTAREPERSGPATREILAILAGKHRFHPEDKEALSTWDTTEMSRFLGTFMLAFKSFLAIVGSLTLVVGGIGVSNIMNVVVDERTREIGIKMALGARPGAILGQFLMETLLITAAGGIIGLLITAGLCAIFPAVGLTEHVGTPVVSAGVAGATAGLLGLIGLVAGYFPARTASRLDPVVAMRT